MPPQLARLGQAIVKSTLLPESLTAEFLSTGFLNNDGTTAIGMPWESSFNSSNGFMTYSKGGNVPGYSAVLMLVPDIELVAVGLWPQMQVPEADVAN